MVLQMYLLLLDFRFKNISDDTYVIHILLLQKLRWCICCVCIVWQISKEWTDIQDWTQANWCYNITELLATLVLWIPISLDDP